MPPVDLPPASAYARYELRHMHTGTALYSTTATQDEILRANGNFVAGGEATPFRFFPFGEFRAPQLHTQPALTLSQ